ncbi:DUF4408 domain-containing protein [Psidium guajava]|nr:DUF4408 domain-containing protein [Psidium guajava]
MTNPVRSRLRNILRLQRVLEILTLQAPGSPEVHDNLTGTIFVNYKNLTSLVILLRTCNLQCINFCKMGISLGSEYPEAHHSG